MSRSPDARADASPRRMPFRFLVRPALGLLCAMSVAGCGMDAGGESSPAADPDGSTTTTPAADGELVVFEQPVAGTEDRDLYVVEAGGGEPALLRSPGDYPHWSADGSRLAFNACLNPPACTTAVALLERTTGEVHGLRMPDPEIETHCTIWAPTGDELACDGFGWHDPKLNGVYTIRASDGQGLARITANPGGEDLPLAYSPDGIRLLLSRTGSRGTALFVTPVSGGRPDRITPWGVEEDSGGWSADGRTIVFASNGTVYRVGPDGQGLSEITLLLPDGSPAEIAFDVSFSPDGQRIVFSLGSPAPGIYQAALDGGEAQLLASGELHHATWGAASRS
jgi:Tol biopolymer transport system component